MKTLVINQHSFVDVITNSSTELYVCDKEKSLEAVKEILVNILNSHNKATGREDAFEDVFSEPHFYTQKEFDEWKKSNDKYKEEYSDWGSGYGYERQENVGKIIVTGATDNSIPYAIDSYLEQVFGNRFHLG
jgi:hypothetical protein